MNTLNICEMCDSNSSGLHPFANMAIIHRVTTRSETER